MIRCLDPGQPGRLIEPLVLVFGGLQPPHKNTLLFVCPSEPYTHWSSAPRKDCVWFPATVAASLLRAFRMSISGSKAPPPTRQIDGRAFSRCPFIGLPFRRPAPFRWLALPSASPRRLPTLCRSPAWVRLFPSALALLSAARPLPHLASPRSPLCNDLVLTLATPLRVPLLPCPFFSRPRVLPCYPVFPACLFYVLIRAHARAIGAAPNHPSSCVLPFAEFLHYYHPFPLEAAQKRLIDTIKQFSVPSGFLPRSTHPYSSADPIRRIRTFSAYSRSGLTLNLAPWGVAGTRAFTSNHAPDASRGITPPPLAVPLWSITGFARPCYNHTLLGHGSVPSRRHLLSFASFDPPPPLYPLPTHIFLSGSPYSSGGPHAEECRTLRHLTSTSLPLWAGPTVSLNTTPRGLPGCRVAFPFPHRASPFLPSGTSPIRLFSRSVLPCQHLMRITSLLRGGSVPECWCIVRASLQRASLNVSLPLYAPIVTGCWDVLSVLWTFLLVCVHYSSRTYPNISDPPPSPRKTAIKSLCRLQRTVATGHLAIGIFSHLDLLPQRTWSWDPLIFDPVVPCSLIYTFTTPVMSSSLACQFSHSTAPSRPHLWYRFTFGGVLPTISYQHDEYFSLW
ncbi:unnamed protein product [Prunus armeniaca]|uniref:Uncharacterized protein n=1 Tax=Prunus armeniaca TaxID=36596 RepID=A0A6J5XYL5_PRUAR|nr:unnamed protein product [Prunus armeniaca]